MDAGEVLIFMASSGTGIDLVVPVIQSAVGGTVKAGIETDVASKVSYSGEVPLVFGVQAAQLAYDDNRGFTTTQPLKPGDAAVRERASEDEIKERPDLIEQGPVYLQIGGPFARIVNQVE